MSTMTDIRTMIAAGLERAFATHGFAEPNIETLREAAGVSLRTLYRYMPSRGEMVLAALEHRHRRYLDHLFTGLPEDPSEVVSHIIDRVAEWMEREASHGCLFHAAVAASPADLRLMALLAAHKAEVAGRVAEAANMAGREDDIGLILEGLTQSFPIRGANATISAKRICALL